MQFSIADVLSHRARLVGFSAVLVAMLIVLALTRPHHAWRHHHVHHLPFIGQCGEHHHMHALPPQAASVHSYYVYY